LRITPLVVMDCPSGKKNIPGGARRKIVKICTKRGWSEKNQKLREAASSNGATLRRKRCGLP